MRLSWCAGFLWPITTDRFGLTLANSGGISSWTPKSLLGWLSLLRRQPKGGFLLLTSMRGAVVCSLCKQMIEHVHHILLHCSWTIHLWSFVYVRPPGVGFLLLTSFLGRVFQWLVDALDSSCEQMDEHVDYLLLYWSQMIHLRSCMYLRLGITWVQREEVGIKLEAWKGVKGVTGDLTTTSPMLVFLVTWREQKLQICWGFRAGYRKCEGFSLWY